MIAIGIDIGGMSIKGAAVDSNGRVYEKFSMPFVKGEPGEVTIRKLAEIVKEYITANGLENKIAVTPIIWVGKTYTWPIFSMKFYLIR